LLITTSRRPCHRARLLGRELTRVLPNAEYAPRGIKSVRKLASFANTRNHKLVMIIGSHANQLRELRFLDVATGWRWLNARIELGDVKLQKDLGQKVRLVDVKIVVSKQNIARNFAHLISRLWGLQFTEELPSAGGVAMVGDDGKLRVEFHADPSAGPVGPILHITHFEVI